MVRRDRATRRGVIFGSACILLAIATIAYAVIGLVSAPPESWTLVLTVIGSVVICAPMQVRVGPSPGFPLVGVAVVLLAIPHPDVSPFVVVGVWAIGIVLAQCFVRRNVWHALRFAGLGSLSGLAFVSVMTVTPDGTWWLLPELLLATCAYYTVFLCGEFVRYRLDAPFHGDGWRFSLSPSRVARVVIAVTLAATAMNVCNEYVIPWLERDPDADRTPLIVLLAAATCHMLARRSAYTDVEYRLSAVVDAAVELPLESGASLAAALRARAKSIVDALDVDILDRGPQGAEIGAPVFLGGDAERYLIAARKIGGASFTRDDERALSTLAHVASETARIQYQVDALEHRANSDPLTGLPNYGAFQRALEEANEHRPYREAIALLFIDLDNFKKLNDNFGHRAGDEILRAIAERLRRTAGGGDFVSRVGGDEFVVVLTDLDTLDQAKLNADRIVDALSERLTIEGKQLRPVVSAGLAFSSHREINAQTLVEDADRAMLQVKRSRHDAGLHHGSSVGLSTHRSTRTNEIVARAIENDRLSLAFQPIVDLTSGEIWAFEALVRYVDPELGPISPPSLVSRAKSLGLMNELTRQVVRNALEAAESFRALAPSIRCITVNLELGQISERELGPFVREAAGAHPDLSLCIELNERSLRSATDQLRRDAEALQSAGIIIALDDYGSDDSVVGSLVHFPMNILKIDKSLISNLDDARQREVVKALQGFSDNLSYTMVVEGIETAAMVEVMRELGTASAQGYYFGRPVSFALTRDRLQRHGTRAVID
ncbi:EAL domain-containing protein [Leucobacter tardus]|uniref:EAL domain-containing protein n=1 Tax=Leucobacter tardus TaxID=501483 RepID=A0A939QEH4_9MICO|nr:EAL domain-containing protein [Leucobacter tardus]MBO2989673.1 EAL domain-containing protein [Leucobacter tardus]